MTDDARRRELSRARGRRHRRLRAKGKGGLLRQGAQRTAGGGADHPIRKCLTKNPFTKPAHTKTGDF
jgi:hypothetical protein